MVNDETVVVVDKYDREGFLVNIGEYYLFQPRELSRNNTNLSVFDRSVPLDVKRSSINIKLNEDTVEKTKQLVAARKNKVALPMQLSTDVEDLIASMDAEFHAQAPPFYVQNVTWYEQLQRMVKIVNVEALLGITPEELRRFQLDHMMESLNADQTASLVKHYLHPRGVTDDELSETEERVRDYLEAHLVGTDTYVLSKRDRGSLRNVALTSSNNAEWKEVEIDSLSTRRQLEIQQFLQQQDVSSPLSGYIDFEGVFVVRRGGNKGTKCGNIEKKELLDILESFANGLDDAIPKKIEAKVLCVLLELALRKQNIMMRRDQIVNLAALRKKI
jgi:hypothetical protein